MPGTEKEGHWEVKNIADHGEKKKRCCQSSFMYKYHDRIDVNKRGHSWHCCSLLLSHTNSFSNVLVQHGELAVFFPISFKLKNTINLFYNTGYKHTQSIVIYLNSVTNTFFFCSSIFFGISSQKFNIIT